MDILSNAAQHTLEWYRCRLGYITGSNVGVVMRDGKGKTFTDTAEAYLYQLIAERTMNPLVVNDDESFELYLKQVNVSSKPMQWGNEQESNARKLYELKTKKKVVEVGSCRHKDISMFASSPDGFYYNEDTNEKLCLEIKCLGQKEYVKYLEKVKDGKTLLALNSQYFYQCHSHMMVTGASATDFVLYNPFQSIPIYIVRIEKDQQIADLIAQRVCLANKFIEEKIERIRCVKPN